MTKIYLRLYIALLFSNTMALANLPNALIYDGPGVCPEDCLKAASNIAKMAGFTPIYVKAKSQDYSVFRDAAVWIQPGGVAGTAAEVMSEHLKNNLRAFLLSGGGYVGFCAGAFLATQEIGDGGLEGLGILNAETRLLHSSNHVRLFNIQWGQNKRHIYWEGGPYFKIYTQSNIEVMATYPNGLAAAVRAPYGAGRVFVTGLHPEAPKSWKDDEHFEDPDGDDFDLAVTMVKWTANSNN